MTFIVIKWFLFGTLVGAFVASAFWQGRRGRAMRKFAADFGYYYRHCRIGARQSWNLASKTL